MENTRLDGVVAFCYHLSLSQPVIVWDALLLDARLAGEAVERSIAAQIEFWAKIGRALEPLFAEIMCWRCAALAM